MKILFYLICLVIFLDAHQLRENYLQIHYNEKAKTLNITLEVETRPLELNNEKLLDDSKNGIISFKELRHHQKYLALYVRKHFKLFNDKVPLLLNNTKIVFHRYQSQTYMSLSKNFDNILLDKLHLKYNMFFEFEKNHKLLIHLNDQRGDYILNNKERRYDFSSFKMSQFQRLYIFVKTGIYHILDGSDHLLFILMILLPSVKRGLKISLFDILKIVTTFSVAHSITLFISGLGLFRPNIMFIETSIAFSILTVAFMNFKAQYEHVNKKIVFLFGLLHGFGFANVLEIAQVNDTLSFVVALFGFNLGVEFGQIFVILMLLPFLYFISISKWSEKFIKSISLFAMLISAYWVLQRVGLF